VFLQPDRTHRRGEQGLEPRYAIETADWIWHPDDPEDMPAICRFRLEFDASGTEGSGRFHVSADQQYELFLDGRRISHGPESGDIEHWSFATFDVSGLRGKHCMEATVWWAGDSAPTNRMTMRKGFILKGEGALDPRVSTGSAAWQVQHRDGFHCLGTNHKTLRIQPFHDTVSDLRQMEDQPFVDAVIIAPGLENDKWRRRRISGAAWQFFPARLDEQRRWPRRGGYVRAVWDHFPDLPFRVDPSATELEGREALSRIVAGSDGLDIPPRTKLTFLWDLDDYICGYSLLHVSGGRGARLRWCWDESLFVQEDCRNRKGNRNEVINKWYRGCGDTFILDGAPNRHIQSVWWRSGRYILVSLETDDEPLKIHDIQVLETGYDMDLEGRFEADIPRLSELKQICLRGLQESSHDTYLDCPYYEQRMFVGDSRIEALITYTVQRDRRLPRRSIELFDFSRSANPAGLTTARYPCRMHSGISTFSMIWIWMIHDYHFWADDPDFVRECLPGMRAVLNALTPFRDHEGLLANLPGRNFIEHGFPSGDPPGAMTGVSAAVNALYLNVLQRAVEIEGDLGNRHMAAFFEEQRGQTGASLLEYFWDGNRGCLADDPDHVQFSEHTLALSLLSDILSDAQRRSSIERLLSDNDLRRCDLYFRHYLFEAFFQIGEGQAILDQLGDWYECLDAGLKTTPEGSIEEVRSDCHGWTAHPLFHCFASIAGIRPDAPGFKRVCITPHPGTLPDLRAVVPHPRGAIDCQLDFRNGCRGVVHLPEGTRGRFVWDGTEQRLDPGKNTVCI
jgi:hypothetical protein